MRIAYLDCFSGISGDMFVGALVDSGVSLRLLEEAVAALDVGASLRLSRVNRSGIMAAKVDVLVEGKGGSASDAPAEHVHAGHEPSHSHTHGSKRVQLPEHNYGLEGTSGSLAPTPVPHEHTAARHRHGRGLSEICKIIHKAAISEAAKNRAVAIFEVLGAAEGKIHGTDIEKVHFHEVGAVDAIVDIVCAAVGAEALGADEIVCSPLNVGGGTATCDHGVFPVPAPATLELLKDAPIFSSGIQAELVTPTGAAIVRILANRFAPFPHMMTEKIGYGAGSRDFPGHANVLRLTVGEAQDHQDQIAGEASNETITVLETNLDDMNPQVFGYVMDRLLEEGALDAFGLPAQMKKNRPGMLLTVLCRPQDAERCTQIILTETTTLGVRYRTEHRQTLHRKWVTITTTWGDVRFKVASLHGVVTNYAPEYEDCRRIAVDHHVALKTVMQEAVQGYLKLA